MSHSTQTTHLSTSELLYGTDSTTGLVAVELAGPDRVAVYRREGSGTIREDVPFQPWLVAERQEPWQALRPRPEIERLEGDHTYRYLVRFSTWNSFLDASRAARETGERYFAPGSAAEHYLMMSGRTLFKGMTFDDLRRLQLDIETAGFDARDPNNHIIAIALRLSDGREEVLPIETSERDLLDRLTERIQEWDPDVIEGHNLFNFDLPYIATRAAQVGSELRWGRDGSPLRIGPGQQRFKVGALTLPYSPAHVYGRHIIDTYQQIQRYDTGGHLTSYGLKNAVDALGLTRPDREFVPGDQIRSIWRTDPERIIRYALDDVRDVDTLSRLALPTEFYQTQLLPRTFQDVATGGPGGKINDLMVRAYILQRHSIPAAQPPRSYAGGYADLLEVGAFSPVVKCDVESLYPSIMLVEGITSISDTLGAYLPILSELTRRRLHAKAKSRETKGAERAMWEGLQSSFKVLINSFYGYLGFSGGLFNDYDAAERVTLAGQRIIKETVERLRETGARPIEVDTDGVYFVPPDDVRDEEAERAFVEAVGETLPAGIRLSHDGRYKAMLSLKIKTYALLTYDDRIILKGSALRSRRMEACFREFIQVAARAFLEGNREAAREAYFALGERIRRRELDLSEFVQWAMLNDETIGSQPRLRRLLERLGASPRGGDRYEIYERQDGELAVRDEYANDENLPYLLRRLHETAARFRALFSSDAEFTRFFPPLTLRTDLDEARNQEATTQLSLF
ncbi:MAG TPA: 3'-5' exonuclease [Thermomicrobiales bacterium]